MSDTNQQPEAKPGADVHAAIAEAMKGLMPPDEVIHTNITISLSFMDRIRALFGRNIYVRVRNELWIRAEGAQLVLKVVGTSQVGVAPIFTPRPQGVMHSPPTPPVEKRTSEIVAKE